VETLIIKHIYRDQPCHGIVIQRWNYQPHTYTILHKRAP